MWFLCILPNTKVNFKVYIYKFPKDPQKINTNIAAANNHGKYEIEIWWNIYKLQSADCMPVTMALHTL